MKTIKELRGMLDKKEVSSVELTKEYLDRADSLNGEVNAYITISRDEALDEAERADKKIAEGGALPLTGIPLAVKDNICIEGVRTTCASKMLENFKPIYNATAIEKLNVQGAVWSPPLNQPRSSAGSGSQAPRKCQAAPQRTSTQAWLSSQWDQRGT